MLCPEGTIVQNEPLEKDEEPVCRLKEEKNAPFEGAGAGAIELNSYKNPKTWKKSLTNFFRNQLRSTKSNEGDHPSGSKEKFEEKEVSHEQKWQSLGKMFRRQSLGDHWNKSSNQGEPSTPHKRFAVKKVLSSYFGKNPKTPPLPDE